MVVVKIELSYSDADKLLTWQQQAKKSRDRGDAATPMMLLRSHGWAAAADALDVIAHAGRIEQEEIG